MSTATDTALDRLRPVPAPARIGQATVVEQSRAVAEVQAQVIVAQQMPRNVDRAEREMLRSCGRKALAEKAFYRYPRGGQQVSGESITLAKELARCWGNIDYGIAELRRDDLAGESEMMAYAWDLEANTRPRTTFIVPHVRDKRGGSERLTDVRDVYENNANMGSRRMREMIFNIMPPWFIEEAKAACYETLARDDSDGATIAERATKAVERFGRIGVRPEQLVRKIGAPQDKWSPADLAQLGVIFRSIERHETTKEDEFGATAPRITAADITGDAKPSPAQRNGAAPKNAASGDAPPPSAPAPEAASTVRAPAKIASGQQSQIKDHFARIGHDPETAEGWDAMLAACARLNHLAAIAALIELTQDEAARVIGTLKGLPAGEAGAKALAKLLETGEVPGE